MSCDFSEKEQSNVEEWKIFGSLGKNVQNLKTFEKGQVCDNCMQWTAGIGPDTIRFIMLRNNLMNFSNPCVTVTISNIFSNCL